jgi:hypothetical protein
MPAKVSEHPLFLFFAWRAISDLCTSQYNRVNIAGGVRQISAATGTPDLGHLALSRGFINLRANADTLLGSHHASAGNFYKEGIYYSRADLYILLSQVFHDFDEFMRFGIRLHPEQLTWPTIARLEAYANTKP